jgi:hypothetical protein
LLSRLPQTTLKMPTPKLITETSRISPGDAAEGIMCVVHAALQQQEFSAIPLTGQHSSSSVIRRTSQRSSCLKAPRDAMDIADVHSVGDSSESCVYAAALD